MRDFLLKEIKVGDTLVYPIRRRSAMWLSKITVTDVGSNSVSGTNTTGRRVTIFKTERSIIVEI
jgi:endonuclease/exonuclease/phosphatase family metal-dependent hydrolase